MGTNIQSVNRALDCERAPGLANQTTAMRTVLLFLKCTARKLLIDRYVIKGAIKFEKLIRVELFPQIYLRAAKRYFQPQIKDSWTLNYMWHASRVEGSRRLYLCDKKVSFNDTTITGLPGTSESGSGSFNLCRRWKLQFENCPRGVCVTQLVNESATLDVRQRSRQAYHFPNSALFSCMNIELLKPILKRVFSLLSLKYKWRQRLLICVLGAFPQ